MRRRRDPIFTQPVVVPDADPDAEQDYDDDLLQAEVARATRRQGVIPRTEVRPAPTRNVERFVVDGEEKRRARRRQRRLARRRGTPLRTVTEVDDRGVRGAQKVEPFTPQQELALRRSDPQLYNDIMDPYFNEEGRRQDAPMSTSWVDNVLFEARVISSVHEIQLGRMFPRRIVSDPDRPVLRPQEEDGAAGVGGEYAVFEYTIAQTDPVIESAPHDVLDVQMAAQFDGVARTLQAGGNYRLRMADVHPYLETANERPVRLPGGVMIRKMYDGTNRGLTAATVEAPYYAYRFRKDPTTHQWLLVSMRWWLMRHHLMGLHDAERFLYYQARFSVNGEERAADTFIVLEEEDPASNPLAPRGTITLLPNEEVLGGALEVLPGEAWAVELQIATELRRARFSTECCRVVGTRWMDLPLLGFRLLNTSTLIEAADSRNISDLRDIVVDVEAFDTRQFGTAALGLEERRVSFTLAPSVRRQGGYALLGITIGPVFLRAVHEALADARTSVDQL